MQHPAALATVLGGAPADHRGHEADQVAGAHLTLGQADGRDVVVELDGPIEPQKADVIVEAISLEVWMLPDAGHLECLHPNIRLLTVQIVLAQFDLQLFLFITINNIIIRLVNNINLGHLRLPTMVGEAMSGGQDLEVVKYKLINIEKR